MTNEHVTWSQNGHTIVVHVTAEGYSCYVDGDRQGGSLIQPPSAAQKILFEQRGAVGLLGNLVIYRDRAQELEAIRTRLQNSDPLIEFYHLERDLLAAMEGIQTWQDRNENPGFAYQRETMAYTAYNAWCMAHCDLYETEMARRQAIGLPGVNPVITQKETPS